MTMRQAWMLASVITLLLGIGTTGMYLAVNNHPTCDNTPSACLSTAIEEPSDEAPVPVMYRVV